MNIFLLFSKSDQIYNIKLPYYDDLWELSCHNYRITISELSLQCNYWKWFAFWHLEYLEFHDFAVFYSSGEHPLKFFVTFFWKLTFLTTFAYEGVRNVSFGKENLVSTKCINCRKECNDSFQILWMYILKHICCGKFFFKPNL